VKHLICYYLWKIERNVPIAEIRKLSVTDAMRSVAVAWNSSSYTGIHDYFTKGNFGREKSISNEDKYDNDWRKLK
jgi:hypothetical protein